MVVVGTLGRGVVRIRGGVMDAGSDGGFRGWSCR